MLLDRFGFNSLRSDSSKLAGLGGRWALVRAFLLVDLIAGTSFVLGATTSFWSVPPYLVLMGWLLGKPLISAFSRSELVESVAENGTIDPIENAACVESEEKVAAASPSPELLSDDAASVEIAEVAPAASKTKTKKPRARKGTKTKVAPPTESIVASWVQVAPGKFVRVETAVSANPGPSFAVELEVVHPDDVHPSIDLNSTANEPLSISEVVSQSDMTAEPFEWNSDSIVASPLIDLPLFELVEPIETSADFEAKDFLLEPTHCETEDRPAPVHESEVAAIESNEPDTFEVETSEETIEEIGQYLPAPAEQQYTPTFDIELIVEDETVGLEDHSEDSECRVELVNSEAPEHEEDINPHPPEIESTVISTEMAGHAHRQFFRVRGESAGRQAPARRKRPRPLPRRGNGRVGASSRVAGFR